MSTFQPKYTFFLTPDSLVVAADLAAKHEHPGAVGFAQMYVTYEAIGCRHGDDRSQVGPMAIAQFEVNSYVQPGEAIARRLHPELFLYLDRLPTLPKKRGRTPGQCEPTKKKDFRFPVRLLEALKAAADGDGMSDSEWLFALLKGDTRIQRKLFEDCHEQADFSVEEATERKSR